MAAFSVTSILAMGGFAAAYGAFTNHVGQVRPRVYQSAECVRSYLLIHKMYTRI